MLASPMPARLKSGEVSGVTGGIRYSVLAWIAGAILLVCVLGEIFLQGVRAPDECRQSVQHLRAALAASDYSNLHARVADVLYRFERHPSLRRQCDHELAELIEFSDEPIGAAARIGLDAACQNLLAKL